MSHQIIASELLLELSDEQQQLLAGGADSEDTNSNFVQKQGSIEGTTSSGPQGSSAKSQGTNNTVNTGARDTLKLGLTGQPFPRLRRLALNNPAVAR